MFKKDISLLLCVMIELGAEFIHTIVKAAFGFFQRILFFVDVSTCRIWRHAWHSDVTPKVTLVTNGVVRTRVPWSPLGLSTIKSNKAAFLLKGFERATPQCCNNFPYRKCCYLLPFTVLPSIDQRDNWVKESPSAADRKEHLTCHSVKTYDQIQNRQ